MYWRKSISFFLAVVAILISSQFAHSKKSAFSGKRFFVGFMQNEILDEDRLTLELIIRSELPAEINVKAPEEFHFDRTYSIKSDSILRIDLPSNLEITESEVIKRKAVEITSDVPICVYAFSSQTNTSDSYIVPPISQWGEKYVAISYPNDQYIASFEHYTPKDSSFLIPRKSEFLIIASQNDTKVNITPKSATSALRAKDKTFQITLERGECFLVKSYRHQIGRGDLTGSIIESDKPTMVVSGHVRTAVPQFMGRHFESKDHLAEALLPFRSWGRRFYSVPFGFHNGGDLFKVTCADSNTIVTAETQDTTFSFQLNLPGDFHTVTELSSPAKWSANNPVQIGHFIMRIGGEEDNIYYDPSLVILPPVEQFISETRFLTLGNGFYDPYQYMGHRVYLVFSEEALRSLKVDDDLALNLDDNLLDNAFPNSNYYWTRLEVDEGERTITCEEGFFSGVVYGYGQADSYAYLLGSTLNSPFSNDSTFPSLAVDEYCGRISGTITEPRDSSNSGLLYAVMGEESYNYEFDMTTGITDSTYSATFTAKPIDLMKMGKFVLKYSDKNGNAEAYQNMFYGVEIDIQDTIDFKAVELGDSTCIFVSLLAQGYQTVRFDSIVVEGDDDRFELRRFTQLPKDLNNGDRCDILVCFKPKEDFSDLRLKIRYYFDCDRYDSTLVLGKVYSPGLRTEGYDFGKVCLGDSVYGDVTAINVGNVNIEIDTISEFSSDVFKPLSVNSALPRVLPPGDTLKIAFKFKPMELGGESVNFEFVNALDLPAPCFVRGAGVGADIRDLTVDWGDRRVGTANDTVVYIKNLGDCDVIAVLGGFAGDSTDFQSPDIIDSTDFIFGYDSLKISASFKPLSVSDKESKLLITLEEPFGDSASATFRGKGVIPVIDTNTVVFDTIPIFDSANKVAAVIKNVGSERLWLNLVELYGDDSCFTFNGGAFDSLENFYVKQGDSVSAPIDFHPQKIGKSELYLRFEHDALPNYERSDTAVRIVGFAAAADTISPQIVIADTGTFIPCVENNVPVSVSNRGNVPIELDSIFIVSSEIAANWGEEPRLPFVIEPESKVVYNISVIPEANLEGELGARAVFNDSINYETKLIKISPRVYKLKIEDPGVFEFSIGDSVSLEISGLIPHSSKFPINFNIKLKVKNKFLYLLNDKTTLFIEDKNGLREYTVELRQSEGEIRFVDIDKIEVSSPARWILSYELLVLLADRREFDIEAEVYSERCFDSSGVLTKALDKNICSFNLRQVEFGGNLEPDLKIAPNPVKNQLEVKFKIKREDIVNITIFNQSGEKIRLLKNLNLKKGSYSLIFEISSMASGVYTMRLTTSSTMKNRMFIITK